ncbi:MAG TPA: hypothetical protein VHD85_20040 [Terracidiphilus sp.]|jgi:hypothetical protein|nr:hypothetical protein [Terracidiphilus sp.]
MTDDPGKMSCAEFQARLPELISSGCNVADHEHLKNCDLCRALLADLETIAEAARQLFPSVDPSDKLWAQIESAIQNDSTGEPAEELKDRLTAGLTPQPE